jgi:L-ascorbate metabolism protein UlaG (beta-lactamase superfamily)
MDYLIWYGHSAFELNIDGKKILIDPWLSNPLSKTKAEDIKNVDIVVVTHTHEDHTGDVETILSNNSAAKLFAIFEHANSYEEKGMKNVIGANIGGAVNIDGLKLILTSATHSSALGMPTGIVIIGKNNTIYHAGDTGLMMDMKLIGELYKPDIAILPIGGHFVMGPYEAAKAVKLINPTTAIPMHYQTFPLLWGTAKEFENEVQKLKLKTKVITLKPGEKFNF